MKAILFLLRRALWPEKGSLSLFALCFSVLGVALGIALLMLVLAVMSGFQGMLESNYTRITSEMVVIPPRDWKADAGFKQKILNLDGVKAATPFNFGQAMVLKGGVGGVVLEGIDLESTGDVVQWETLWTAPPLWEKHRQNANWIWIGDQLAKKLEIKAGETIHVLVAEGKRKKVLPFIVTAITKFGIYDHDLRYARISLPELKKLFGRTGFESMYKTRLDGTLNLEAVRANALEQLGDYVTIKPWYRIHPNVFLAVRHQKMMLFLVLEIIVALAAVNVVIMLVISTQNRRRDVAILRAMGMKFREVVVFFLAKGTAIGLLGIVSGVALGLLACQLVQWLQPELLSEAIYNVTKLPLQVRPVDVGLVSAAAFVLCVVFSVLPALKAARYRPVEALRYE